MSSERLTMKKLNEKIDENESKNNDKFYHISESFNDKIYDLTVRIGITFGLSILNLVLVLYALIFRK